MFKNQILNWNSIFRKSNFKLKINKIEFQNRDISLISLENGTKCWFFFFLKKKEQKLIFSKKTYINYYFFFLVSHLLLDQILCVLLFFFIIFLIVSTYKYNKLLLIWQKCLIRYLIIFIYAFNVCCLIDFWTINNFLGYCTI